jgi:hypothetical protein
MGGVLAGRFGRVCRELGVAADHATYDRLVAATDVFRDRYEQQARRNVEGALALLER